MNFFPAGPRDLLCEKNFHATPNVVMKMRRGVIEILLFYHKHNTSSKHTEGSRTSRLTGGNFKFERTLHAADGVRLMHEGAFSYADVPFRPTRIFPSWARSLSNGPACNVPGPEKKLIHSLISSPQSQHKAIRLRVPIASRRLFRPRSFDEVFLNGTSLTWPFSLCAGNARQGDATKLYMR
jgi:hypothetical protein